MNDTQRRQSTARTATGGAIVLLGLLAALGGCYPYDRESTSDYDVVATTFDTTTDFKTKWGPNPTYARPDEVQVVTDPQQDDSQTGSINAQVEQAILAAIDQNMAAYGYTLVADPATADVHITPVAAENTWVGGSCYPYYWDWWYAYPPGYGWCYPVYYSYTTGTVIINMLDPTAPTNSKPLWVAGINGIISTASSNASRVTSRINEAFAQSPYLKVN